MRRLPATATCGRGSHYRARPHDHLHFRLIASLALLILAGCARKPLPEKGTLTEQLYAHRCGTCHRAYQPSTLTPAMWELQVDAMELKINAAGMPPLTPGDRQAILAYLERHASKPQ
jgi:mono/diheme cytochrome c family protein